MNRQSTAIIMSTRKKDESSFFGIVTHLLTSVTAPGRSNDPEAARSEIPHNELSEKVVSVYGSTSVTCPAFQTCMALVRMGSLFRPDKDDSMARRLCLLPLAFFALSAHAQAPHALTPAEKQRVDAIVQKMTPEQKLEYIGGTGFATRPVPSVNLPAFEMSDGPVGVRSNSGFPSTTYAGGIGLAASWDRELAARVGAGIGRDDRARGIYYQLGPGVNIYRSPRNGRNFEYFGEDPFLSGQIAANYILGLQSQGVSATVKHYLGNNSEFLRHDSNTQIDDRTVHEIYLPAFEAAVKKGHVGAVMDSYNLIDGAHATQNGHFNIEVLRKEWGFQNTLMSDWVATYDAVGAANGGLDLEMPTGKFMNPSNLQPALKAGTVTQATIDDKVRHILATAMEFGWLDRPQVDPSISYLDPQNAAAALDSARESAVLLKNEGSLLPLDKNKLKSILVVGPDAYPGVPVGGGSAAVKPFHAVSAVEGLSNALAGKATVYYDRCVPELGQIARATQYSTEASGGKPGLTLESFQNDELSGPAKGTANVHSVSAKGLDIDVLVADPEAFANLVAALAGPPKKESRRWTGYFTPPTAGKYAFILDGSGEGSGNRVYVDGTEIIDNWDLVRSYEVHKTLDLTAGPHKVVVEDKQNGPFGGKLSFGIADEEQELVSKRAKELAGKVDAVVVMAGFDHDSESEGGDRSFSLPYGQHRMISDLAAINKNVITVVTSGGNVDSQAWLKDTKALLETWYAGQEGGRALAEILLGDVNPSGHLPATFERRAEDNPTFNNYYPAPGTKTVTYKEGLFVGYRGYEHNHVQPLFPFGFGLSYTSFKFANLQVTPASSGANPQVTANFDVTNTGSRAGADIAQVYVSEDRPKEERPERELKGFERVMLQPGETKHVSVPLDARAFAWYDPAAKKWTIDPGKFTVRVGDSVEATPLEGAVTLTQAAAGTRF